MTMLTVDDDDDRGIEGTTAFDALEKGFDDLIDLCDVVVDKFTVARDEYMTTHPHPSS